MLQRILATLERTPLREALSEGCLQWARAHGVSQELLSTLAECAYEGPIRIGPISLSRLATLEADNSEENAAPIDHGFLLVGYGVNGDPVAVELRTGRMAFISHDELWEGSYGDFEECIVRTSLGFHEFWAAALTSSDFPRDALDAEKRWPSRDGFGGAAGY
jgi:hypothetical protein